MLLLGFRMPFSKTLEPIANDIYSVLDDVGSHVEIEDFGWENYVWTSEKFKWAHLQKFYTEKVSILHCVVMPHKNTNAPIYGFDVNELTGNLIGMFLDLTPVDDQEYYLPPAGESRPVPTWGDFFSTNFVCCKPEPEDLYLGVDTLKKYVNSVLPGSITGEDYQKSQQRYIDGQKRNPQTYRMLSKHVGADTARRYIDTILFPNVTD